ncbi:hypothetical protein HYPSUDRAFT_47888 [Hypholoma sublateritium FD-334 SS-4]|uniref:Uncharacterized protein n=1 Tax=Hypholoma sublateritium (strain FD-334 SS-4) TaxID=945553 RepID=A0A0D2P695_HYPSF|nr:hypothetical protein HYPSUDRAFT_47888 [Hypholoma sublateritium FD-334 SS-4]
MSDDDVPENILVFNCITTLLSHLPRATPLEAKENLAWSKSSGTQDELKISDAFARLAVSQHGTVAVSTNRGHELHLMICATQDATESSAGPSTFSGLSKPIVVTPVQPDNLNGRTACDYMKSLVEDWVRPTLPSHLWILSKMYMECADVKRAEGPPGVTNFSACLFRYTAAMSYEKIKRRLFSNEQFIDSLRSVTHVPIPSKSRQILQWTTGSATDDNEETSNDFDLLGTFVIITEERTQLIDTPIPNLVKLAKNLPQSKNSSYKIYDDDTCMEFHQLLLSLLARLGKALERLSVLDAEHPEDYSIQFKKSLDNARMYGYALLRLSKGRAFRVHIQNIGHLLKHYHLTNKGVTTPTGEEPDKDGSDEDLETIQHTDHVGWLRLVVAPFDAVETVIMYVTSHRFFHTSIAVKILVAPLASGPLYPWRELLTHPKYFPTRDNDVYNFSPDIPNKELLEFVDGGVSTASKAKEFSAWVTTVQDGWTNRTSTSFNYQQMCQAVKKLVDSDDLPVAVRETVEEVHTTLQKWYAKDKSDLAYDQESVITNGVNSLYKALHPLSPGNAFFCNLENLRYQGAMHCEACLASLLPDDNFSKHTTQPVQPGKYDEVAIMSKLQGYGRIIGVSKRCCVVCVHYLFHLANLPGGQEFAIQGSHSVISACTLPPWTPSDVVDKMIHYFAAMLRRDLIALRQKTITFDWDRKVAERGYDSHEFNGGMIATIGIW